MRNHDQGDEGQMAQETRNVSSTRERRPKTLKWISDKRPTFARATRDRRPKRHVTSLGVWYVFFFLHSIFIGTNSSYRLLQVFLLPFSTDYNSRKPRQRQWRDGEGETAQETRYVSWVWYVFFSSFTFVLSLIHC